MHKEPGGDRTRTADPQGPKGCPIPEGVLLSNRSWGKGGGRTGCRDDGVFPSSRYACRALPSLLPADGEQGTSSLLCSSRTCSCCWPGELSFRTWVVNLRPSRGLAKGASTRSHKMGGYTRRNLLAIPAHPDTGAHTHGAGWPTGSCCEVPQACRSVHTRGWGANPSICVVWMPSQRHLAR